MGYHLGKMEESSLRVCLCTERRLVDSLIRRVDKMEDNQITIGRG